MTRRSVIFIMIMTFDQRQRQQTVERDAPSAPLTLGAGLHGDTPGRVPIPVETLLTRAVKAAIAAVVICRRPAPGAGWRIKPSRMSELSSDPRNSE